MQIEALEQLGAAMHLTITDIQKWAKNPSVQARTDIAGKVASTLSAGVFNEKETALAVEIVRVLAHDTEVNVRRALSLHLRDALNAPADVVAKLARDVAEVAVPLLKYSYVLTEEDLVEIVRSTREAVKLVAIASRDSISGELTEALLDTQIREVMQTVLSNSGAVVRDAQLLAHWNVLLADKSLLEVLVGRGGLSLAIAEKLYAAVTEEMKGKLAHQYHLPMIVVEEAADDAREWATLGMLGEDGEPAFPEADVEKLIAQLYGNHRLTYSLVIRSLCTGDMSFFEMAMARLAGVPRVNARILMFDSGPLGFQAMYEKARMPQGFYEAIHTLLKISLEETGYGRFRRDDFRRRVIARIQSQGLDRTVENMQYLLTIIGGKIATAETLH